MGAAVGYTLGVSAALFHLNIPALAFRRVALSPSVSGVVLGALVGLILATAFACLRTLGGSTSEGL
jgi:hypothetical protein